MADNNNMTLSLCVDKVLDHVGASEQIRRIQVEKGLVDEVVIKLTGPILYNDDIRWHNFGSWCEGTTTKGLASDMDKVFYDNEVPAFEDKPDGYEQCYLIINDGTTKPGYVKLQLVYNGVPAFNIASPVTETDQFGRVCLCRDTGIPFWNNILDKRILGVREERTGPAITLHVFGEEISPETDIVHAYICYNVPSFTRRWIHRPRKYDWPSKQLIDKMSTYGCFLVSKGHPSSQTENLDWRISFSFQERELMFNLNSTQHKCYILLKMIKQNLVTKMNDKSISSYHLKTALFYTIENNSTKIWIPDSLVYCTELCLKQILDWLNKENCPNFFVPEENMFDRLSSGVMKMTAKYIRDMLESDGQYLMSLTCDKFGELLQESLSGKVLPNLSHDAIAFAFNSRLLVLYFSILWTNRIVTSTNKNSAPETLSALQSLVEQLRMSDERLTSEKVFREIKKGLGLILPTIHLQIAQTIAAIMLTVTDIDRNRELMQDLDHHFEQTTGRDIISQRLIKASLLFKENKLEECERILADCETSLEDCILYACSCTNNHSLDELKKLVEKVDIASISLLELRKYKTPCLMFLPSQADLVPTPLQYEMYRSVGASTDTVHPDLHYWYGSIVIDVKVYLFFLQYLAYSKLNRRDLAEETMLKLAVFIRKTLKATKRLDMGHVETGLNLLGWICKYENKIELATQCFYRSWQVKPDHNAAKWHMLIMIYEQYIRTKIGKMRNSRNVLS